jgi:hypothetical protein
LELAGEGVEHSGVGDGAAGEVERGDEVEGVVPGAGGGGFDGCGRAWTGPGGGAEQIAEELCPVCEGARTGEAGALDGGMRVTGPEGKGSGLGQAAGTGGVEQREQAGEIELRAERCVLAEDADVETGDSFAAGATGFAKVRREQERGDAFEG